ncbi:hypothetical protein DITRI_Ditri19aG0200800 [Diplodiscus trichospermus]
MNAMSKGEGGAYFLYGYGGIRKTFIWRKLSAAMRSTGESVLTITLSGIAFLLLIGPRITHSRFAIPINVNEDSTCSIKLGIALAELLNKTAHYLE